MAKGVKCVKYIGVADVRRISDDDWDKIHLRMQGSVVWDAVNGFTELGERLRDGAIAYLRSDPDFVVVDEEE